MSTYFPRDDQPIVYGKDDQLNRGLLAQRLIEAIRFASLPQVMGIEGDWGSGKTSLLQNIFYRLEKKLPKETGTIATRGNRPLITEGEPRSPGKWLSYFNRNKEGTKDELVEDENIRAVWFEAWRYQHEPEPVIALLHEIRAQLLSGDKWEQRSRRLWVKMKQGAEVFLQGLFASTNEAIHSIKAETFVPFTSTKVSVQMPDVAKNVAAASASRDSRLMASPLQSELIRGNLDLAISLFLGDEDAEKGNHEKRARRLVIIIDDLDRCGPEAVCRLLESIKIHLDLPSCFFLLGINRQHIETSLTAKLIDAFHDSADTAKERLLRDRASNYVEKITTNLVRIPKPDSTCCVNLAMDCLAALAWPDCIAESIKVPLKDAITDLFQCGHIVPLPSNPRRIKALCNQFQLSILDSSPQFSRVAKEIAEMPEKEAEMLIRRCLAILFIFSSLKQFFHHIYRIIETSPSFYNSLVECCQSKENVQRAEAEVSLVLGRIHFVARGFLPPTPDCNPWKKVEVTGSPPMLLPDPPEGIGFFIQELLVTVGDLPESEVRNFLCSV